MATPYNNHLINLNIDQIKILSSVQGSVAYLRPASVAMVPGSGTARSPGLGQNTVTLDLLLKHFHQLTQKVSPILHKPSLAKVKLEFFHSSLQYCIVEIKSKMHNGQKYKALVLSLFYYPFLVKTK